MLRHLSLAVLLAVAVGCGDTGKGKPATDGAPKGDAEAAAAAGKMLLLREEPAGAKGVKEVRASAKTGDDVVVVGRVGGRDKPFTEGMALFLIVDPSLKPATECECPWDYCDTKKKDLEAARATVKFVGAEGEPLKVEAREAFGIKELSTVVVKGRAVRDGAGNLVVVGSGLFVKEK